jgi:hypothetical protein
MSDIEPDIKDFLKKILATISMVLLWMLINSSVGIGMNYAFFEDKPRTGNYIFYCWFIISFVLVFIYIKRKWKD